MFEFKIKLSMYMYHDILFINKHIVWRSIYVPYIFHLRNSENIQGRRVYVTLPNIINGLIEQGDKISRR
jgi:hypothetical protein